MLPSSCQGVVFAAGKGKCHEMLSLRTVVVDRSIAMLMPASPHRRSMSVSTVSGVTFKAATRLLGGAFIIVSAGAAQRILRLARAHGPVPSGQRSARWDAQLSQRLVEEVGAATLRNYRRHAA